MHCRCSCPLPCSPPAPTPATSWPQNDGRAAAQPACDNQLRVLPACNINSLARLGSVQPASWVLEAGPAAGKYYIRAAGCGSPLYLGFHKTNCSRTSPSLFAKASTQADVVWTLELVSAGLTGIAGVSVSSSGNAFNILRVLVRPAAGPGAHAAAACSCSR